MGLEKISCTVGFGVGRRGQYDGGPEGQLESLRRSTGVVVGASAPSYPSLCSLRTTVKGVRLEARAQILEGVVSPRSAWLLASPQGAPLAPHTKADGFPS